MLGRTYPDARAVPARGRAPISAPIGSPKARTPRPSSASPNRCSRRISSSCAAPRGHLFERALALEPNNPEGVALQRVRGAEPRRDSAIARERFTRMLALNPPPQIRDIIEQQLAGARRRAGSAAPAEQRPRPPRRWRCTSRWRRRSRPRCRPVPCLFVAARDPKAPGPPFAVKRLPAQFPVDVELIGGRRHARNAPHRGGTDSSRSSRASRSAARRPRPAATRSDKLAIMSGKDGRLNIVIDRLAP